MSLQSGRPKRPTAPRPGLAWGFETLLIVSLWALWTALLLQGRPAVHYDTFRDMAAAHAILRGEWGSDPSLLGERAWYPPGDALFHAAVSRLTGRTVTEVFSSSLYWLNWLGPLLVFRLGRISWGTLAGWLALPCVYLGSRWWLVHAIAPMPSVHGTLLLMLTLWLWRRALTDTGTPRWLSGLSAGITFWVHPLNGGFALAIPVLHAFTVGGAEGGPGAWRERAMQGVRHLTIGTLLAAPALTTVLGGPLRNIAPRHWFAPELHDPMFALHAGTPLVWVAGSIGMVLAARNWRLHGWLVIWFVSASLGCLAGYAAHDLGWNLPWLIPHEFQWHAQMALMLAAAGGLSRLAERWAPREGSLKRVALAAAMLLMAVGPAVLQLRGAGAYVLPLGTETRGIQLTAEAIQRSLGQGAVLATDPGTSYLMSGLTGLKVVALPAGHMNPRVDAGEHSNDLDTLMLTRDRAKFEALVARYHVSGILLPAGSPAPPSGGADSLTAQPEPIGLPVTGWRAYRLSSNRSEGSP